METRSLGGTGSGEKWPLRISEVSSHWGGRQRGDKWGSLPRGSPGDCRGALKGAKDAPLQVPSPHQAWPQPPPACQAPEGISGSFLLPGQVWAAPALRLISPAASFVTSH